jgi:hypothetical protein
MVGSIRGCAPHATAAVRGPNRPRRAGTRPYAAGCARRAGGRWTTAGCRACSVPSVRGTVSACVEPIQRNRFDGWYGWGAPGSMRSDEAAEPGRCGADESIPAPCRPLMPAPDARRRCPPLLARRPVPPRGRPHPCRTGTSTACTPLEDATVLVTVSSVPTVSDISMIGQALSFPPPVIVSANLTVRSRIPLLQECPRAARNGPRSPGLTRLTSEKLPSRRGGARMHRKASACDGSPPDLRGRPSEETRRLQMSKSHRADRPGRVPAG